MLEGVKLPALPTVDCHRRADPERRGEPHHERSEFEHHLGCPVEEINHRLFGLSGDLRECWR